MEELNRKIPQLPWIVAVIGIVIAGYFFFSASQVGTDITNHKTEMEACNLRLEQYKKLEKTYGYGSERYYADKPLLVLKSEGAEGKITIFWDNSNITVPKGKKLTAKQNHSENLKTKWTTSSVDLETHLAELMVTPGKKAGCYPITFTDNVSEDKFQVLVVVK